MFVSGNYFGSHFIMGGERFDMSQPESYLFGENTDLNFLGCKPIPVSLEKIYYHKISKLGTLCLPLLL